MRARNTIMETAGEPVGTKVISLPLSEHTALAHAEFTRIADLQFKPADVLPAHRAPATLLVSSGGQCVTGSVIMGRHVFQGSGEIVVARRGSVLRFAAVRIGAGKPASITLTLPWRTGRANGWFACRLGRRGGGGALKGVWWQDRQDLLKDCGKWISTQIVECSDPGGGKHKSRFQAVPLRKMRFHLVVGR